VFFRSEYIWIGHISSLVRRGAPGGQAVPPKHRNAVQRTDMTDREAAGLLNSIAALLFSHDDFSSLLHRALHWSPIGSVQTHSDLKDTVIYG